jgi:hypothetical protein
MQPGLGYGSSGRAAVLKDMQLKIISALINLEIRSTLFNLDFRNYLIHFLQLIDVKTEPPKKTCDTLKVTERDASQRQN